MKSFLICGNSSKPMKLNESESTSDRYILQGLFAGPFGVENRNKRIYEVDEYLKHLQYLRDDIKKGEPLLGELDHPDDRFEVKLKEASHRVLDLWYDKSTNTIQGKIELLNTPNGKLAQALVDQGIPLHISSRAAGTVNSDKTVSIQQIYTFDLVCKPGFAGAVLHRVNESKTSNKYTDNVYKFLTESERFEAKNAAPQFGMLNEDVSIMEINSDAKLRKEAKNIKENNSDDHMEDMHKDKEVVDAVNGAMSYLNDKFPSTKNITYEYTESEDAENFRYDGGKLYINPFAIKRVIERYGNNKDYVIEKGIIDAITSYNKDMFKDENTEAMEEIMDKASRILNNANGIHEEDEPDNDKEDDGKDSDKEDNGVEIISVRAETSGEGVEIIGVEADDDSKEDDDKDSDDEDKSDENDDDKSDENDDKDGNESTDEGKVKTPEGKEKEMLLDCDKLKERKTNFMEELDEKIDAIKNKGDQRKADESYNIQKYPMSSLLNESNFAGFMGLKESQKNNVINYLVDNGIADIDSVNENWKNGIEYRQETEVWLKYAPKEYRELFENASESVKDSIRNTASFILFENQNDINVFWENTGLTSAEGARMLNEQFVSSMPKVVAPVQEELPYGKDFINAVTEMAVAYNR